MYFSPATTLVSRHLIPAAPWTVRRIDHAMDRGFERFIHTAISQPSVPPTPRTSLTQDEQAYTLSLDVPGVTREQLDIGIEDQQLRLSTVEGAPRRYHAVYELPVALDATASEARLVDGVLTLRLVKQLPVSRMTRLQVN